MPYQFLAKFKIPLIIIGLLFLSFLLTNYNRQASIEQFFFGAKNLFDKDQTKKDTSDEIYSILNGDLASQEGKFGAYIKDLKSGEVSTVLPNEPFTAASIYKLAVMYKTYDALENNEIEKGDTVSASQSHLDNLLEAEEGIPDQMQQTSDAVISYTVSEALRLMITISDNYSALLLAEKFGWGQIDNFLKQQGVSNFTLNSQDGPTATVSSTAQILEKIYRSQAVSKNASNEMEKLLLNQTVGDRIPKYLPQNVKVAHKTGELGTVRNDAGIVFGKKSDYIFVFFTDTPNPDNASETIASLSKKIYDSLENQQ